MLKPVLTHVATAKDGASLTVKDTTGAYSAENPGGYGAPNPVQPTLVGMRWRYWADDLPYANRLFSDAPVLAALLGTGHAFSYGDLGLATGTFPSGVHHLRYYPFEASAHTVSVTKDSKKITVTAGTAPSTWDPGYVACVLLSAGGLPLTKVLLLDQLQPLTATEFYVDTAWTDVDTVGLQLRLATEADLKVLVSAGAEACLVGKIGELSDHLHCDRSDIDLLTDLITQKFAADVKFQCKDYSGAHNLIVAMEKACLGCHSTAYCCKTCSS